MLDWIVQNLATIIISVVLIGLSVLAIRHIIKNAGKGGCAGCKGGREGCPGCHLPDQDA